MKVLIVNTILFRENGVTAVIMNYFKNMNKTGMQVDFLVVNEINPKFRNEIESNGSNIYHIPRNKNVLSYMNQLRKLVKKNKYDIVHVHGNSAMMLIDLLPIKLGGAKVRIAHSHNTTCSHMTVHKLFNPMFQKLCTHPLACGEAAGKWLFPNREFTVLNNGIDVSKFAFNPETREKYRAKINAGNKKVIGHVGNFLEQKNHTFLLEVFADLLKKDDNYILLLIGTGLLMDDIKAKAEELKIQDNIIFLGTTFEVPEYMQAMDSFVLPSLFEGLAIVSLEAQATGLQCLISNQVTMEAKMSSQTEFLPINDKTLWSEKILGLKDVNRESVSVETINTLTERGYDIKSNANKLNEIYKSALDSVK
ncbi:MAG: glycosyltransferase family 1 protein [Acutalibacteraceae bacterium]|nr:glycosyltransferase family 1 protein [Acutalibacteraceae bacterium]